MNTRAMAKDVKQRHDLGTLGSEATDDELVTQLDPKIVTATPLPTKAPSDVATLMHFMAEMAITAQRKEDARREEQREKEETLRREQREREEAYRREQDLKEERRQRERDQERRDRQEERRQDLEDQRKMENARLEEYARQQASLQKRMTDLEEQRFAQAEKLQKENAEAHKLRQTKTDRAKENQVFASFKKLTNTDDLETHLAMFEELAELNEIPKDRWVALLLPLLDTESAVHRNAMDEDVKHNYTIVKTALTSLHGHHRTFYRTQWKTADANPKNCSTYQQWGVQLEKTLTTWLTMEGDVDVKDWVLREKLLESVNPEVGKYVALQNPHSFKGACEAADLYASQNPQLQRFAKKSGTHQGPPPRPRYEGRFTQSKQRQEDDQNTSTPTFNNFKTKVYKYDPGSKASPKTEGLTCWLCREVGHVQSECPKKKDANLATAEQGQAETITLTGTIFGKEVKQILIDTGCTLSQIARKWMPRDATVQGYVPVKGIHATQTLPMIQANIRLHGRSIEPMVAVNENTSYDAILGTDVDNILAFLQGDYEWIPNDPIPITQEANLAKEDEGSSSSTSESRSTSTATRRKVHRRPNRPRRCAKSPNYVCPTSSSSKDSSSSNSPSSSSDEQVEEDSSDSAKETTPQLQDDQKTKLTGGKEQLLKAQRTDPSLKGCRAKGLAEKGDFFIQDELLFRRWTPPHHEEEVHQVVLPRSHREAAMRMAHFSPFAGHFGKKKTTHRVMTAFFWPKMRADIQQMCRSCETCQKTAKRRNPRYPLVPLPVIEKPFSRVAMDIVGPLPPTSAGHRFILVLCDYASRFPEAVPLVNTTSKDIAGAMVEVFARTGFPEEVLTDRGSNFCSEVMEQTFKVMGTRHLKTSAYHPQCDGMVERFNGTLKAGLRKYVMEMGKEWNESLPYILFAYREMPHESTGHTPFELLYGRNPRGPMNVLHEEWVETVKESSESVVEHLQKTYFQLERAHEAAKSLEKKAKTSMKNYHDKRSKVRSFKENDLVLVLMPSSANKLYGQWKGPFPIQRKLSQTTYRVKTGPHKQQMKTFHVNMLSAWQSPAAPCLLTETGTTEEAEQEKDIPTWKADTSNWKTNVNPDLDKEQTKALERVIEKFEHLFSTTPGKTSLTSISIDTGDAQPTSKPAYRVPHARIQPLKDEIADMQRAGLIVPSTSEWGSPALHVAKPDGTRRLCINFQKLNGVTKKDSYPMPRIEEMLDELAGAKYISTLDLTKGYWQIPVEPASQHKTAFLVPFGKYECLVMPFGLAGAPAVFQRLMDSLFQDLTGHVAAYLDDIVIYSESFEEHLAHVEETLSRLAEAHLTLKPSKCKFGMASCLYLGHQIGHGMVRPLEAKIASIQKFARPVTKKDVRAFLGLTGYYRRFVQNYATKAAPLTDATCKDQPDKLKWTEKQVEAFEALKDALSKSPVLQGPDFQKRFCLQTDASDQGIGAVLCQTGNDGSEKPVAFYSKKFTPAERNYTTFEKECLAVVRGIGHFQVYLSGVDFLVETDHACLQYLESVKNTGGRLTRWALSLQDYSYEVKHKPGKLNGNADGLSRQAWMDETRTAEREHTFPPEGGRGGCYGPREN